MIETFRRAHDHKGAAFVEVFQNCNVFNDGAFEGVTAKEVREPTCSSRSGTASRSASAPNGEHGVVLDAQGRARIVEVAEVGEDALLVHDESRDRPERGVHAVPPRPRAVRADADRRVPGRASASSTAEDEPPARRRREVQRGPGDLERPAALRRHLGGRVA